MRWKENDLITVGDLLNRGILACDTPEEAKLFMATYSLETEHAAANVGYLAGYLGSQERQRIQEWFDVEHPIFGKRTPTSVEAFEGGRRWAQK